MAGAEVTVTAPFSFGPLGFSEGAAAPPAALPLCCAKRSASKKPLMVAVTLRD